MPRSACLVLLLPLLLVTIGVGCHDNSASTSEASLESQSKASTESRGTIGVSLLTFNNPFFKVIADTITSEAEKHGYEVIALSANEDAATQNDQINNFIVQEVSAIVLSPCESRAVVPVIQAANEAGIPVITVDIPCNEEDVEILTQIATDNFGGGQLAGQAMIEALDPQGGKVAILEYQQAESCRLRVNGFLEVIEAYNAGAENPIEISGRYESGAANDKSLKATEDALQTDPDLLGIFAINDPAALGALSALETAGKADDVVIIGFDGQPEGKQAIKEGKIYADPIQYPDKMGAKVVESIVAHFKGEDVPPEQYIPTTLYRQTDAQDDPDLK